MPSALLIKPNGERSWRKLANLFVFFSYIYLGPVIKGAIHLFSLYTEGDCDIKII
jgi:hypothetical protein